MPNSLGGRNFFGFGGDTTPQLVVKQFQYTIFCTRGQESKRVLA